MLLSNRPTYHLHVIYKQIVARLILTSWLDFSHVIEKLKSGFRVPGSRIRSGGFISVMSGASIVNQDLRYYEISWYHLVRTGVGVVCGIKSSKNF